jgi:hypothetical protein
MEDNIKTDLLEMGWGVGRTVAAQDEERWRVIVNAIMNLRVT